MRKFMSIQSFRHPKLQNQSNGNDFTEVEEYCLPLYHISVPKTNTVLIILVSLLE